MCMISAILMNLREIICFDKPHVTGKSKSYLFPLLFEAGNTFPRDWISFSVIICTSLCSVRPCSISIYSCVWCVDVFMVDVASWPGDTVSSRHLSHIWFLVIHACPLVHCCKWRSDSLPVVCVWNLCTAFLLFAYWRIFVYVHPCNYFILATYYIQHWIRPVLFSPYKDLKLIRPVLNYIRKDFIFA